MRWRVKSTLQLKQGKAPRNCTWVQPLSKDNLFSLMFGSRLQHIQPDSVKKYAVKCVFGLARSSLRVQRSVGSVKTSQAPCSYITRLIFLSLAASVSPTTSLHLYNPSLSRSLLLFRLSPLVLVEEKELGQASLQRRAARFGSPHFHPAPLFFCFLLFLLCQVFVGCVKRKTSSSLAWFFTSLCLFFTSRVAPAGGESSPDTWTERCHRFSLCHQIVGSYLETLRTYKHQVYSVLLGFTLKGFNCVWVLFFVSGFLCIPTDGPHTQPRSTNTTRNYILLVWGASRPETKLLSSLTGESRAYTSFLSPLQGKSLCSYFHFFCSKKKKDAPCVVSCSHNT